MLLTAQTVEFLTRISAKVIYGTIILGAVLGSLSDPLPRNLTVIVTVFFSLQAVSLADAYARSINEDMANHRVTPWRDLCKSLLKPSWAMTSTIAPITLFGFAWLGFITQSTALTATKVILIIVLLFFGFVSRRLSGGNVFPSLVAGMKAALIGYVVVHIKLWAKYLPMIGY